MNTRSTSNDGCDSSPIVRSYQVHYQGGALHKEAPKRLSELADNVRNKGLNVRTEVGTANDVAMELVRVAEQDGVDMIVISTHGMTGWRQAAFGSVASNGLRYLNYR